MMRVPRSLIVPSLWPIRHSGSLATANGLMGPAVRLLLIHYDIGDGKITGTGPKKNLLKSDVLKYIASSQLKPVVAKVTDVRGTPAALGLAIPPPVPGPAVSSTSIPPSPPPSKPTPKPGERFVDIPLTNMRSTIAKRLLGSKQSIPHAYALGCVNAGRVIELREGFRKDGIRVSINDFLVKAVASALRAVPAVNVQYVNGEVKCQNTIDISVAVATPAGLITPIIFNADTLGVTLIGEKMRELAKKAKDNKLQPAEFQGGTFTVSNLGMFGSVTNFTAIINPPQAAILAVGGTQHSVIDEGNSKSTITVSLCYDSRAITEIDAKRFLEHFKLAVEEPELILLGTGALRDLSALL